MPGYFVPVRAPSHVCRVHGIQYQRSTSVSRQNSPVQLDFMMIPQQCYNRSTVVAACQLSHIADLKIVSISCNLGPATSPNGCTACSLLFLTMTAAASLLRPVSRAFAHVDRGVVSVEGRRAELRPLSSQPPFESKIARLW